MKGSDMARSGYVRVKPHVQIGIELVAVDVINKLSKKNISASEAVWILIKEARPDIAERAVKKAREEGYPVPSESGLDQ